MGTFDNGGFAYIKKDGSLVARAQNVKDLLDGKTRRLAKFVHASVTINPEDGSIVIHYTKFVKGK